MINVSLTDEQAQTILGALTEMYYRIDTLEASCDIKKYLRRQVCSAEAAVELAIKRSDASAMVEA